MGLRLDVIIFKGAGESRRSEDIPRIPALSSFPSTPRNFFMARNSLNDKVNISNST